MEKIKKVGILYHPLIKPASVLAQEIADLLCSYGASVWLGSSWEEEKARTQVEGTDLLVSVGGDGTILRSVQVTIGTLTPIIGVNLGKLGFMTEISAEEIKTALPAVLRGEGWIDERAMLEAIIPVSPVGASPQDSTEGKRFRAFTALNDIVVARGAVARVVNIAVNIDGVKFTEYTADGVIAATATGSTGYSLAAGGPIMYPLSEDYLLEPILPHLSLPYTLVLPGRTVLDILVSTPYAATLSIDGHTNLPLASGTSVMIKESSFKTRFLRVHPEESFFSTLQQKLRGRRNGDPGTKSQNG
jgi:NAD+ kinase